VKFIIINLDRDEGNTYWSNVDGWGDSDSATRFDHADLLIVNLPLPGAWVPDPGLGDGNEVFLG
jgi:hypothetical protein